ncbi:hypothetical protein BDZ91DRAFT_732480 [Kalaharituber pfeilii]|nr:hypothetical protein BDZ91DRAFT_732480 [Kalaharituber pfeilii]
MGYLQPAILLAIAAALVQYIAPYLSRTYVLRSPPADATFDKFDDAIVRSFADGTCTRHHPDILKGCEDIHFDSGIMYAACAGDLQMRRKYMPGLGQRALEKERRDIGGKVGPSGLMIDKMVKWNVETDEVNELELRGFPTDVDFVLHGFDINILSPTNITFYIINHRPFGSVIEKFWHTPGTNHLNFIKTIDIPPSRFGGAPNPNDIFAVPESDQKSAMFVTNDHWFKEGLLRKLEEYTRIPFGSHLSYYDDESGWKIAARNIPSANGLTGTKKVIKEDSGEQLPVNTLYMSALYGGYIRAFYRTYGTSHLVPIQDILLESIPDNPSLSYPSQSRLVVATHPVPSQVYPHVFEPEGEVCPGGVYSFNTNQIGSTFYGQGYTGEVPVETIFLDWRGLMGNATTTAILIESDEEGGKSDLYVTGLMMEGITRCKKWA